ncbi:antibiotic biosynthesis monooxygenase [Mycolicibacterium sp. S2-37]|uniref:putative quinol monooxygenase n=1 Tax=Mycolicibacterium sp. S2-37 TaxID=2810297 RepID=UPI001A952938|nr:antibiotic biosynthesis monooxygenase [Mycolicibacterium sp. S2-37]MBO0676059.1 antibiotic biosynthesis monooxygenase [Mycolicibacterium sp. S2-37]
MVIVAGYIIVDPSARSGYLAGCADVVRQARAAEGCLDFAICPDILDPRRINIHERWASQAAVEAFRGDGVGPGQQAEIRWAEVAEYDVAEARELTDRGQGAQ